MGIHTWIYKNRRDFKQMKFKSADKLFGFRQHKFAEISLKSYKAARRFVLKCEYLGVHWTDEISIKQVLLRMKLFFKQYPSGVIEFG